MWTKMVFMSCFILSYFGVEGFNLDDKHRERGKRVFLSLQLIDGGPEMSLFTLSVWAFWICVKFLNKVQIFSKILNGGLNHGQNTPSAQNLTNLWCLDAVKILVLQSLSAKCVRALTTTLTYIYILVASSGLVRFQEALHHNSK